jgi:hypothetical protein
MFAITNRAANVREGARVISAGCPPAYEHCPENLPVSPVFFARMKNEKLDSDRR